VSTAALGAGFLPPVIPSLGCDPFGKVLVRIVEPVFSLSVGFLRVPFSVFRFFVIFVDSIIGPTNCEEGEKSARAEIRDARVRRYSEQGVTMSLSTPFETGLVFDPGPQPG